MFSHQCCIYIIHTYVLVHTYTYNDEEWYILLQDAGYGEKSLFAPEQDEDDEAKIEDEVCG